MERCATGVVSQASEFSDNLNGTVGTSEARSAGRSRRDDFDEDPDVARWEEVKKVQTARMEWAKKLGMSEDDVQAFIDNKLDLEVLLGQSPQNRRNMAAYLKRSSGPMPRWMAISGLFPEAEKGNCLTEEGRRKRLRALYKTAVLLIKRALGRHAADPDRAERSVYWDPIGMVCRDLDIPPSKLSQLLKEHSGHSLSQVIDTVRAAGLKGKLRAGVRAFLEGRMAEANAQCDCVGIEKEVWAVWGELRKSRKWPEFSPNTWANVLGFASYRRLYRACVSVYGKTPYHPNYKYRTMNMWFFGSLRLPS